MTGGGGGARTVGGGTGTVRREVHRPQARRVRRRQVVSGSVRETVMLLCVVM